MNSPLQDAHIHLADPAFKEILGCLLEELISAGWQKWVVNGTSEADWPDVTSLSEQYPNHIIPSYGLHPWNVKERSESWLDALTELVTCSHAGVGECGLDRWINGHDINDQITVLRPQIELAAMLNRPLTLHCIRAWGHLIKTLRTVKLPSRGFLVHAFSGSRETAHSLLDLGAYFSYSPYFTHPRKASVREIYSQLPLDRLLIETDAPAMVPPENLAISTLPDNTLSHPANLRLALQSLQSLRNESPTRISEQLCDSFCTFFGQN